MKRMTLAELGHLLRKNVNEYVANNEDDFLSRITLFASNVIGSWWMITIQTVAIGAWFYLNLIPSSPTGRFDNERFDTLRLLLALQSVYTAPLILMAQRRVAGKDRKVLYEIADDEKQAMHIRRDAMERRVRLEEKVDKLLARFDAAESESLSVNNSIDVDEKQPASTSR